MKRVAFLMVLLSVAALSFSEMRDPTRPYNFQGPVASANVAYQLSSILASPSRQVAIINGKPLQVGATINGAKLIRIEQQAVWLEKGGKKFSVTLPKLPGIRD